MPLQRVHLQVQAAVKALIAVVAPYWDANSDANGFKISQTQRKTLRETMAAWEKSCELPAALSPDHANRIVSFLHTKSVTFATALQQRQALPFDVMLLGIVSCAFRSANLTAQLRANIRAFWNNKHSFPLISRPCYTLW